MPAPYKIVGYLADWNDWSAGQIAGAKMTHLNYAFAGITDGVVSFPEPNKMAEVAKLKKRYPDLKLLISIGGWGAEGFSDAALTAESRKIFAAAAVQWMLDHGFDGIDLDWEYPGSALAGIKARPEDQSNFPLLLRSIREHLAAIEKRDSREYLLTIATGATPEALAGVALDAVSEWVDSINVMTYDLYSGFATTTGHHTNLFPSAKVGAACLSTAAAVDRHLKSGVPPRKIVVGCAFYGRGWAVAARESGNGLNQPVMPGSGAEYPFHLLQEEYIDRNGFQRQWDTAAKAPFLWNGSRVITYDDPESLKYKMEYIKRQGLGGAMFWEYSLDWRETLLNQLWHGLQNQ